MSRLCIGVSSRIFGLKKLVLEYTWISLDRPKLAIVLFPLGSANQNWDIFLQYQNNDFLSAGFLKACRYLKESHYGEAAKKRLQICRNLHGREQGAAPRQIFGQIWFDAFVGQVVFEDRFSVQDPERFQGFGNSVSVEKKGRRFRNPPDTQCERHANGRS